MANANDFFAGLDQVSDESSQSGNSEIPEQTIVTEETTPAPSPETTQVVPLTPTEGERHWQGQADRYKAELERFKGYEPVLKQLEQDPHLTQLYLDYMQGKTQVAEPEVPSLPAPPADFDPYQITDPKSDSAKYFQTVVASVAERIADQKVRENLSQYTQAQQQRMELQNQVSRLKGKYQGLDEGFEQFVVDPQNVTPDTWMEALARVYLDRKGVQPPPLDHGNSIINSSLGRVEQNTLRRGSIVNVPTEQVTTEPEDEFWGGIDHHLKVNQIFT